MKKYTLYLIAIAILAGLGSVAINAGKYVAKAQTPSNSLSGWAWSSNIGWLSASSTQTNAGGGGPYGLTVDSSSGNITGYMWSSNIGWVQFGGLSGFPTNGTTQANATVNLSTGKVDGWARAFAGVGRTDGWDGWIELQGANHLSADATGNGGVTYLTSGSNAGAFVGYAWGSDVVGWLQFNIPGSSHGVVLHCPDGSPLPCSSGAAGLSLTGAQANLSTASNPQVLSQTVSTTLSASSISSSETVHLALSSPTPSANASDISVAFPSAIHSSVPECVLSSASAIDCTLTPTDETIAIPVVVTLNNITSPLASYNVPISATWIAGSNPPSTNIVVNVTTPTQTGCSYSTGVCLWFDGKSVPTTQSGWDNQVLSVKQGQSAKLDYSWMSGAVCNGKIISGPTNLQTIGGQSWDGSSLSPGDTTTLTNLQAGTYKLKISCNLSTSQSGIYHFLSDIIHSVFAAGTVDSNSVTIKVYTSSEQEI
jgi:hypothetical protein